MQQEVVYFLAFVSGKRLEYRGPPSFNGVSNFLETKDYERGEVRLIYAGKKLDEQSVMPVSGSTFHCLLRLQGGGGCISSETDFQSGYKREREIDFADESTPKWTILSVGLNIQGICDNKLCKTHEEYGGRFWTCYGLGDFTLTNVNLTCVQCHTQTSKPFVTMAFAGPVTFHLQALSIDNAIKVDQTHTLTGERELLKYNTNNNNITTTWKKLQVNVFKNIEPRFKE
jgi:hypothetical protein